MKKEIQPWDKGTLTLLLIVSYLFFPIGLIIACSNQKHNLREFQCQMILKFIGLEVIIALGSMIMWLCGSVSFMLCGWGLQILALGRFVYDVQSETATYWTQELVMQWKRERMNCDENYPFKSNDK